MSNAPFLFVPTFSWPAAPFGLLYSYQAGSTTPKSTFSDAAGLVPNTNPVELDATGSATVRLGSGSYKFVLLDQTNTVTLWTQDNYDPLNPLTLNQITALLYPQTAAEASLGVVPSNLYYPVDPYVDPRRYGADPTGVADSTIAVQTALNVAYSVNGVVWIGNGCNFLVGALSLTLTGANSRGIHIMGSGAIGSALHAIPGLTTPLLTLTSSNPATVLIDGPIKIENLLIGQANGVISGGHGISLKGAASWHLSGVQVIGFDHNLDLVSSLVGVVNNNCLFQSGNIGVSISLTGTVNTTNLIRLENSRMTANATWGIEYNGGTQLHIKNCDIEANGTSMNFATGGVHIKGQLSPDASVAGVLSYYTWYEGNLGTTILIDAQSGASTLNFALVGGHILAAQSGTSITCAGCTKLLIQDLVFCDTANLTAIEALIENSVITTLTDSGITYPTYINVQTGAANIYWGRRTAATLGITGCTTSPTVSATFIQQADQIVCYIPDFTATSNTNACTITGLPAALVPALQHFFNVTIEDNSGNLGDIASMAGASTILTLYKGGSSTGFTTSGTKGIRSQELRWKL